MIGRDFRSVIEFIRAFPNEQSCLDYLEQLRWRDGNIISPFDPESKVYRCQNNKFRCSKTKKYFKVTTGTMFEGTHVPLDKWFLAIWIVTAHKQGISSVQLAKDIEVTQKTSWFMLQRIRSCFGIENNNKLSNEAEADETYIGGLEKNKHGKKKTPGSQGRSTKTKSAVFGIIERGGKLNAIKVQDTKGSTLMPIIKETLQEGSTIYTDEHVGYKKLKNTYSHSFVNHKLGNYVNGNAYTNTVEGFWSLLKNGIRGIYRTTSKKHLQLYIDEFVFRYNTRSKNDSERFNYLVAGKGKRTTYKKLISA